MKHFRTWIYLLGAICLAHLSTFAGQPSVLLVTKSSVSTPIAVDQTMEQRLEELGFNVELKKAAETTTTDADGKDLLIISASVNSGNVGNKFKNVETPVLCMESLLFDNFGMCGTLKGTDYGTAGSKTMLKITSSSDPMAAGFSGNIQVATSNTTFSWGKVNANARKIATLTGNSSRAVIFAYNEGAVMPGLVAPAPRTGFFMTDSATGALNASAWSLFEAAAVHTSGSVPVMLVVGNPTLNTMDQTMKDRLESLGYLVEVADDDTVVEADTVGKAVVIVSDSVVGDGTLKSKLKNSTAPVINMDIYVSDNFGLIGTSSADRGTQSGQTQLTILNPGHVLATGLTGDATVSTSGKSFAWGKPNANATVVAHVVGDPSKALVYVYNAGATLADGSIAPNRRAGFFMTAGGSDTFNEDGWRMFDALVDWSARKMPALFVVGNTTLVSGDQAVKTRMEELGFEVTVKSDTTATTADATGKNLVAISSSVTPANITTKFKDVTVPVVTWESGLIDDMKFVAANANKGNQTGQTQGNIQSAGHDLAAHRSGQVTLSSNSQTFSWGNPLPAAINVMTMPSNGARSIEFAYEQGSAMQGMNAPARRVSLWMLESAVDNITTDGWALFDAGMRWAVQVPPAGNPDDTDSDGLSDAWEIANFGNLSQTASGNPDGDALTNQQEFDNGTNPNVKDYTLTLTTAGSGSITGGINGKYYQTGTVLTLTAVPGVGVNFLGWSGALSGSTNPTNLTINGNKTVTATFGVDTTPPVINMTSPINGNNLGGGSYTADLTGTGTASSMSHTTGYSDGSGAFDNVVDGGASNMWSFGGDYVGHAQAILPQWLRYDFGSGNGKKISRYRLYVRSSFPQLGPSAWQFQGSNNPLSDTSWVTLDTRTNVTNWDVQAWKTFDFSNTTAYQAYRILVTGVGANPNQCLIEEVEMMALNEPLYVTNLGVVTLGGSASDASAFTVKWKNLTTGGSGNASGTSSWSAANIPLVPGVNELKVEATDAHGLVGMDTLKVSSTLVGAIFGEGFYQMFVLKTDGSIWGWGWNTHGELAVGHASLMEAEPVNSALTGVTSISDAGNSVIYLKTDGTVRSVGANNFGQLGNGTTTDSVTPVTVSGLSGVTKISSGADHHVALKSDGTVRAWGSNLRSQLGDGSNVNRSVPVTVSGLSGVTALNAGDHHTLALLSDGTVRAWGGNHAYQLGDGTNTDRNTPVSVSGLSGVIAVSAGGATSYALKSDGTVWGWGDSFMGQVGVLNQFVLTPRQIPGLSNVVAISSGYQHVVALKSDGTVWVWGNNSNGQLGNGYLSEFPNEGIVTPTKVNGLSNVVAIVANNTSSSALTSDGVVWTWGGEGENAGSEPTGEVEHGQFLTPQAVFHTLPTSFDDQDGDGLKRWKEKYYGSDPILADTNGDGLNDLLSVEAGIEPGNLDVDGDGVNNAIEILNGTNPFVSDSDGDGVNDGADPFPLDPSRTTLPPTNSGDHTAPGITLELPVTAIEI